MTESSTHVFFPSRSGVLTQSPQHLKSGFPIPSFAAASKFFTTQKLPSLTQTEMEQALAFERNLTRAHNLTPELPKPTPGIEIPWSTKTITATFYPEYFLTRKGKKDFLELFSLTHLPDFLTKTSSKVAVDKIFRPLSHFFSCHDYSQVDSRLIENIQGNSISYTQNRIVEEFSATGFSSMEGIALPQRFSINLNPQATLKKLSQYTRLKHYHRRLAHQLKSENSSLSQAKSVLLQIHQYRLNELIMAGYVRASGIVKQSDRIQQSSASQEFKQHWESYAFKALKFTRDTLSFASSSSNQQNYSRFDKLKYGAGLPLNFLAPQIKKHFGISLHIHGKKLDELTPISQELLDLVLSSQMETPAPTTYRYHSVPSEIIENTVISSKELNKFFQVALSRFNLLSRYRRYDPHREGKAPDGLWQVITDPINSSLRVNGKLGVIKIPKNYSEPIDQAVPIIFHELQHVVQHQNHQSLIPLAITDKVGLKSSDVTEAGALKQEQKAREALFGLPPKPINTDYFLATITKLSGGSFLECMEAWFHSHRRRFPGKNPAKTAYDAFDRTIRLFKAGGQITGTKPHVTNTKDLVYTESLLLIKHLHKQNLGNLIHLGINPNIFLLLESGGFIKREDIKPPPNLIAPILSLIDKRLKFTRAPTLP